jgi:hypothetical protein
MGLLPIDNVNSCTTLLTGAITTTGLSMSVTTGTGQNFPSGNFTVRLGSLLAHDSELVSISGLSAADTFTISQRSLNGAVEAWPIGTVVQLMVPVSDDTLCETVSSLLSTTGGYAPMSPTLKANAAQALATSGTIATTGMTISRVNPASASTAVVLQAGTQDGQVCIVENDSANLVTFDVVANSHVADGASDSIAANTSGIFCWNATAGYWSRIKAA